ncbi:ribosome biogenesis protein ERB1 [Ceratobasidium sp. AG-Ba]|nr:ribosome biogenesis protein ERB1 [Ceratobasidium sp. AG-Ba]
MAAKQKVNGSTASLKALDINGNGKIKHRKRKEADSDEEDHLGAGLEMPSDGEVESDADEESDGSDAEPFPELDPASSSEEEDKDEEDEPDVEEDESSSEADSERSASPIPLGGRLVTSGITGQPKRIYNPIEPDYDSDSSTEDDPNRIGNVPAHWYDDMPHIGYTIDGKKVLRPARGDELDKFLSTVENPMSWTSALDKSTMQDTQLTAEELDIIRRLQQGENPDGNYDPYEPTVEWFTGKGKEEIMPLSARPEPKRRFVPSKWEKQKVMKIVRAIRAGRIIPRKPTTSESAPRFYNLWATPAADHPAPLPAPKPALPTTAESYNPPEEYLPTEEEAKEFNETEKQDRERNFLPQKHNALRLVPAYPQFANERFDRLLDLYLAPRVQRTKLNIDPNSLIPSLPSPASLRPFPTHEAAAGGVDGAARVRCVCVSPDGAWVLTGDEGGVVRLWEMLVGREAARWVFEGKIGALAWCPRTDANFFVVGVEDAIHYLIPPFISSDVHAFTTSLLNPANLPPRPESSSPSLRWIVTPATSTARATKTSSHSSPALTVLLPAGSGLPKQIVFHRKGDYLASVSGNESQGAVWIHQTSKRHSQAPFRKVKGAVQCVLFHPVKPHFFVATQRYVRLYDLAAQKLLKTLMPGIRWISSMDVHPSGDHIIVGGYDRKLCWFDLELSQKPYKVLRYHTRAIRALRFHATQPLFASASDDGTIQVFHARVYSDLMTDPLIVPLKVLRGHKLADGLGVLDVAWSEQLPWLASAGADGSVRMWCN